jgi:hypothetical protein
MAAPMAEALPLPYECVFQPCGQRLEAMEKP